MVVTINDIAQKANVSKATVSYVINDKDGVGKDTREKVLKIMEDMDYQPNSNARNLAGKQTNMLGLIIPDVTDMFFAEVIEGVENTANKLDYTLNLGTTHGEKEREELLVNDFSSGRVDGLILMTYHLEIDFIKQLKKRKIPFVFIGNPINEESIYTIVVDNKEAGYKGTEYLIELGHRKIAFIKGSHESWDAKERFKGFCQACKDYGININEEYIKEGEFIKEQGYEVTGELLTLDDPPSAIFAANDRRAIGVLNRAQEMGVKIPGDLSLLGVDDIEAAGHIVPPLTTIRQPTHEMGKKAVDILFDLVYDRTSRKRKIMLSTELIKRQTCAPI
ncbi:MAG: LacI family DNA-binding transcriptional regulator [bacterium]